MNKIVMPLPDQTVIPWERLREFCDKLPQEFDHMGELLFAKRNAIRKVVVEGHTMVVKRYKRCNWLQGIGYGVRHTSKARKAYDNGQELTRRGFSTPRPIAAVEVWGCGGWRLRECYYICDESCTDLDLAMTLNQPEEFDKQVAQNFAQYVAELHKHGVMMIDLNSTNVLFRRDMLENEDVRQRFQLIDINRMDFAKEGEDAFTTEEQMENLTRFTGRMDVFEYVAREYARARAFDDIEDMTNRAVEQKKKHDRAWRRRKAITHPFKH